MKKVIYLSIVFLLLPLSMSAQAPGGHITRKKTSTTTSAPKKTTATPKKTTSTAKSHSSGKPRSGGQTSRSSGTVPVGTREELAPAGMSQVQMDPIIQNLINNMVYVEGGSFMVGATVEQGSDALTREKPAHQVTLSSFSIGRYEVTQEEWQAVMGSNPSDFKGAKRPVENVSWDDCQAFIRKLNSISGRQFRLPTEAEWEYAARGGNRSRGYKYAGSNDQNTVAWYDGNSGNQTHEVGSKLSNELGLYDMSGNVWEWCQDWYGEYGSSAQTNPAGPYSGSNRVLRGGGWYFSAKACRVSFRFYNAPTCYSGLRLVSSEAQNDRIFSSSPEPSYTRDSGQTSRSSGKASIGSSVERTPSGTTLSEKDRIIQNLIDNMVYVQGGTFTMGATSEQGSDAWDAEKPAHQVTLSSFSIGRYEVTQEEWQAVMGSNPSHFKGAKRPVERVCWDDCQVFISKLNSITGRRFRLPTEAEWEYAARGGNRSRGYKYSGSNSIGQVAWYNGNCSRMTHEVGAKAPNELGLYDMSGNVWEWCQDRLGDYLSYPQTNPTGSSSGSDRVLRGGSWYDSARDCRVSYRYYNSPSPRNSNSGLRLAL